jgi:hypothetical protein
MEDRFNFKIINTAYLYKKNVLIIVVHEDTNGNITKKVMREKLDITTRTLSENMI